ncbi:hypothetical protein [Melghirimyces algeriensis]|uniref:Prolipoprotein diacylglyceryl transferase n=1 Tax=Melghirimyces algeriensis TaxID=910412 RepID=A0A521BN29_9BACL|nr:hypothetical protein [Melghirimyces algeriensis]SMO48526.1 hypothetical protein SAMN06264849_102228 [Melghirimyces algeriensis]
MLTTEVLPLGSFLLPISWITLWLGMFAGGKAAEKWLPPETGQKAVKWSEGFLFAALIWFIVWRWSPLLWHPLSVLDHPGNLLFVSGSEKGEWLAWAAACGFLGWFSWKRRCSFWNAVDAAAITGLVTGWGYSLLFVRLGEVTTVPWGISPPGYQETYHPIHWYTVLVLTAVFVSWWKARSHLRPGGTFRWIGVSSGVGLLIVSYFNYYPVTGIWGLAREQWLFVAMALMGWMTGFGQVKRK